MDRAVPIDPGRAGKDRCRAPVLAGGDDWQDCSADSTVARCWMIKDDTVLFMCIHITPHLFLNTINIRII